MDQDTVSPQDRTGLNDFVEAYEAARSRGDRPDLTEFLPAPGHPLRPTVLRELVRVELEYQWEQGETASARHYLRLFPELRDDPRALRDIAFEEYRLRQQAGENPSPDDYPELFGSGATPGPQPAPGGPAQPAGLPDVRSKDAEMDYLRSQALSAMPPVGSKFAGFELVAELGRGAFARVYLARQGDLANRLVALKISIDLSAESQTLAQLQHTYIVPIYSVHQAGPFQAVCMPYFGPTTLADVLKDLRGQASLPDSGKHLVSALRSRQGQVGGPPADALREDEAAGVSAPRAAEAAANWRRLEGLTYVQAILWIGVRLADGLAHAHEHGILHQDLKPANILLTDEGQPMLLDFNLSADTKRRTSFTAAQVGGTLPYMSPEHLEAFRDNEGSIDGRSDLYGLGVIFYEMLTGRLPFGPEPGPLAEVLPRFLEARRQGAPSVRRWNPAVSPAVESIIHHCLETDPSRRYQSAGQLREDLQRQLDNQPLRHAPEPSLGERVRKWTRRHPRLASPVVLGAVLTVALALFVVLREWHARQEAQSARDRAVRGQQRAEDERKATQADLKKARREKEMAQAEKESWEAFNGFKEDVASLGEFQDQLNRRQLVTEPGGLDARALAEEMARYRKALGRYRILKDPGWQNSPLVANLPAPGPELLRQQVGELLYSLARATMLPLTDGGRPPDAGPIPALLALANVPSFPWAAGEAAVRHQIRTALSYNDLAIACFSDDGVPRAFLIQRARMADLIGQKAEAKKLLARAETTSLKSYRDHYWAGCELAAQGKYADAVPLLAEATRLEPTFFSAWLMEAICHQNLEQFAPAANCYSICIALNPEAIDCYANRGWTYLRQKKWADAEKDFDRVLRAHKKSASAYLHRGSARFEQEKYAEAIADLSEALKLRPNYPEVLFLRAKFYKQIGQQESARKDLEAVLRLEPTDAEGWAYRGLVRSSRAWGLARTPADERAALADFDRALEIDPRCLLALLHKARILSNLPGQQRETIRVLDRTVALHPEYLEARLRRGLLLAYQGAREEAHEDAKACLKRDPSPAMHYQVARIYAQTSRRHPADRDRAVSLLTFALRGGYGLDRVQTDGDLRPLRAEMAFRNLLWTARILGGQGR